MKKRHIEFANTYDYGLYQVELKFRDGETEVWHNVWPDFNGLARMIDKSEINSFEVSWEPEETRKGPIF